MTYQVTADLSPLDLSAMSYTTLPIRQDTTQNVNVEELNLYSNIKEDGSHVWEVDDILALNQVHLHLHDGLLSFRYTLEKEGTFIDIAIYDSIASDYEEILLTNQGFSIENNHFNHQITDGL